MEKTAKQIWEDFTIAEQAAIQPFLRQYNIILDKEQPHISGERFLMSGQKVVLVGRDTKKDERLIIKTSASKKGLAELQEERAARETLANLPFAYQPLLSPKELWCEQKNRRLITAIEFIPQETPFLSLTLTEQFDLIVSAFDMLAGVHAATPAHTKMIKKAFGVWRSQEYFASIRNFAQSLTEHELPKHILDTIKRAQVELVSRKSDLERYCDFLTHDDFALHNFRFKEGKVYLIDQSSLRFGNKHESWARFMNYMLIYGEDLEAALRKYLEDNAAPEETISLRLMRIYKAVELLTYHQKAVVTTEDDVRKLSERRVELWHYVLNQLIDEKPIASEELAAYRRDRDAMRSPEEVKRQKALQQIV